MLAVSSRWLPVVVYMALIYYQSAQSSWPSAVAFVWDKLLHAGGYAPLGWLCVRALTDRFRQATTVQLGAGAWLMATIYAASDEWHQSFVPPRVMDAGDFAADAIGAALAAAACVAWSHLRADAAEAATIAPSSFRALAPSNPRASKRI